MLVAGIVQGFAAAIVAGSAVLLMAVFFWTEVARHYQWKAVADGTTLFLLEGVTGRLVQAVALSEIGWVGLVRVQNFGVGNVGWRTYLTTRDGTAHVITSNMYWLPYKAPRKAASAEGFSQAVRASVPGQFATSVWNYVSTTQGPGGLLASGQGKVPVGIPARLHWSARPGSLVHRYQHAVSGRQRVNPGPPPTR